MSIPREKWLAAREDYIRGRGSLATVAGKHGLRKGSVEKRARKEDWTRLRREYEAAHLAKLIPPPPPSLPTAVAPTGTLSEKWLCERLEIHYRKNMELLDRARALLDAKLTASEKPTADELGKLVSALSGIISAEIALLGLNRRREKKNRKRQADPVSEPEPAPQVPTEAALSTP